MPTLDFKGKQFIYGHHLTVPIRTLQTDADKSLTANNDPSLNNNLIIHGDNLYALKALLPKYAGRIKCIYIDPPYNTGNEGVGFMMGDVPNRFLKCARKPAKRLMSMPHKNLSVRKN